ncbi:radical SAM protein [Methanotorris igneus]|uniref:Radical SAM domain protein n=1 Tax=Methanotorris igneus (strain DSM 5666 / JCM 11834 / Kol 5) TaxID=880724 RepID=F6BBK7_METIK|nr:radical SAM protein [Methanotorris igneus]AEF96016.1 Radical SAM domain protein [Methanotorris igneus Kol 5]
MIVYGPVPSRRLGLSLGIDPIYYTCTFDCIYCQLGRTRYLVSSPKEIPKEILEKFPTDEDIYNEVKKIVDNCRGIDYITFAGSGEPTLSPYLKDAIERLKEFNIPICVITNSSLLKYKKVRNALKETDLVSATLTSTNQETFEKIHRTKIKLKDVVDGLIKFRRVAKETILNIELMVLEGINDDNEVIYKLKEIIDKINPNNIEINTPIRPPCEKYAKKVSYGRLKEIKEILGEKAYIIETCKKKYKESLNSNFLERISSILKIRPCTVEDLANVLGLHVSEVGKYLYALKNSENLECTEIDGKKYYFIKIK